MASKSSVYFEKLRSNLAVALVRTICPSYGAVLGAAVFAIVLGPLFGLVVLTKEVLVEDFLRFYLATVVIGAGLGLIAGIFYSERCYKAIIREERGKGS